MQILHAVTSERAGAAGSMQELHRRVVRMQQLHRRDGVGVVTGQDMQILHSPDRASGSSPQISRHPYGSAGSTGPLRTIRRLRATK